MRDRLSSPVVIGHQKGQAIQIGQALSAGILYRNRAAQISIPMTRALTAFANLLIGIKILAPEQRVPLTI